MNTVLYIHGKGGSALESEHYKSLFPDCEVIGLDYQTFNPWDTGQEIHATAKELQHKSENVILIANSIGAFFSMNAGIEDIIKKAYFISPMVDMEKLIMDMMRWANVTEQELKSKGTIHTDFGEDLSWEYLCYVRSHPIQWDVPTHILYGSKDHLMSIETITDFANKHNATLTIMKDGEHWFHTDKQMMFLDNWIKDMKINKATIEDYESIIAFYNDVTERTPEMEVYARWQKGKHPTEEGIRAYIEEGSMYLYKENNAIVGAMAVTMYQGEDYHAIEWTQQVEDNEAAVIHILAVSPDAQGKGIGSEMIREAIRLAQTNGMKAIRLDALASNTPAHKIYKALGFEYRGQQHLYAENTGWTDFYFFEYINHTIYERNNCYMKHEIIELHDVQIIGMAKKIAFNEAKEECPKFWGVYVEKIIKPVVFEGKTPNAFQKAAFDNGVGEFGLCTCDIPNHNCATCAEQNFGACNKNTFTYVIGGIYKGGDVPEGMQLFPIQSGRWLKMHFEGGMRAFQEQYTKFHKEWLPAHPEYKWAPNSCCMEWYQGTDIQSHDYQCGVMMPLEEKPRFTFNTVGLFTNDNKATVEFYTKAFGFTTSWDGMQPNVEMFLGSNRIILFPRGAFEQMVSKKFLYPEGFNGTMELSFDVPTFADVDKEYQNALNNGAKSVLPPTTEPWGQRTCYVADPDGNLIEIGSFIEG